MEISDISKIIIYEMEDLVVKGRDPPIVPLIDIYDNVRGDKGLSVMRDYLYFNDLYKIDGIDFAYRHRKNDM